MVRRRATWYLLAFLTAGMLLCSMAMAQAPSVQDQLQAQYKLVKMGSDSTGAAVLEEGTVLAIQKGGILGTPWGSPKSCPAKFVNNQLQPPSKACTMMRGHGGGHLGSLLGSHIPGAASGDVNSSSTNTADTKFFKTGDKVYATKIAIDTKNERVDFDIVACDTCNKTDPPTYYKSEVQFQFDKGFLETGDVSKIEDTIGQVFSLDSGDQSAQNGQGQGQDQGQGQGQDQGAAQGQAPVQAQAPAQAAPAPAQPASIQIGQSPDQVQAALGQPDKTVDLGAKKIWVYKDLKVTFQNGKVSDVQ